MLTSGWEQLSIHTSHVDGRRPFADLAAGVRSELGDADEASAESGQPSVGRSSDVTGRDAGRRVRCAVRSPDRWIEPVGGRGCLNVPPMDGLRPRMTPGHGLEDPLSLDDAALEKQSGEKVKPRKAEVVLARVAFGSQRGRHGERAGEHREVMAVHGGGERHLEQRHRGTRSPRCAGLSQDGHRS